MMPIIIDIITYICFLTAAFFLLVGALGLIRLPDFWARLHAAGLIDTAGLTLLIIGLILQAGWTITSAKLIVIFIFIIITGPTASHALANAAFISGLKPKGCENTKILSAKKPKIKKKKE